MDKVPLTAVKLDGTEVSRSGWLYAVHIKTKQNKIHSARLKIKLGMRITREGYSLIKRLNLATHTILTDKGFYNESPGP